MGLACGNLRAGFVMATISSPLRGFVGGDPVWDLRGYGLAGLQLHHRFEALWEMILWRINMGTAWLGLQLHRRFAA